MQFIYILLMNINYGTFWYQNYVFLTLHWNFAGDKIGAVNTIVNMYPVLEINKLTHSEDLPDILIVLPQNIEQNSFLIVM